MLTLWVSAGGCLLLAVDTFGQASAPASSPPAGNAVRYRVQVVAPDAVRDVVTSSVNLVRWQDYAEMTEELLDVLAREAVPQAKEAAAASGYFSAGVDIAIDRTTVPVTITLTVAPGIPSRVTQVDIDVTGDAASGDPLGARASAAVRDGWSMPKGDIFTQTGWAGAKRGAVDTMAANAYASARLVASEARVDPDAASASLTIGIDSGPAFFVGDIVVQGLSRYTEAMVRNFSTLQRGQPYSQAAVDEYVRRLLGSGYFAGVQAAIATDPAQADAAPITLAVIEAAPRRLEFGAGYSTDTQYRVTASYQDLDINSDALRFYADARLETKVQNANVRFVRPPNAGGWQDALLGGIERTDIENLITHTASISVRRESIDERNTPAFSVGYFINEQQPAGGEWLRSHALYGEAQYTWRRTDSLLLPTRGWMANLTGGAGVPGASTEGFGRVLGKFAYWLPLSRSDELYLRGEGGAVLARSRDGVPSVFLFRTGGDTTVRGYAFESLGVQQDNATVGGRYYGVASAEVTHWFTPTWGVATFIDAGNATDSLHGFTLDYGYGVGARLRTPIGPFRLDLAYGQEVRQVRIHFSVGLSF
jgi:translocation and assembly module TamA